MKETIHEAYTLESYEEIAELHSVLYRYRHLKTGAELIYMDNDDQNKVFGVAFRTPQETSNGVPHIIEHTVLTASRKYKTKEPFMDLLQSSVATFLNAITYPDKTIYPVASRNDKDFQNLMDVYLDAVFFPNIYQDERVFRQEGWRYQLDSPEDELRYSGVVYNEMRGAFSSPDQVLYEAVNRYLYPDTHYKNNSGGEPYQIPELTYEAFLDFHRRFYHPSNARIFLYGKMDLVERLTYLDQEYLGQFEARDPDSAILIQAPFEAPRFAEEEYSLAGGEDPTNKDYFSWSVSLNTFADIKENFMLDILADALFETQAAPVKLALQKEKLCDDILAFTDQKMQNQLTVTLVNSKPEAKERYQGIIEAALAEIAEKGIDRELLRASINRFEYALREGAGYTTMGILYFQKALDTWLYDGNPADALRYEAPLQEIRQSLESDVWETFIREKFLANPHKLLLHLHAVPGLNDGKDEAVHKALQEKKALLSAEEIADLVDKSQALAAWQDMEDSPEAKATIPQLSLADLETELPDPPCLASQVGSDTLLQHPIYTSGIHYVRLSFPLDHIRQEDLFHVSVLSLLLGSVDTEAYSYQELATQVFLETGGIGITPTLAIHEPDDEILFRMDVTLKTLDEKGERWPGLMEQILRYSKFADDERILEVLKMQLVNREQAISQSGDSYARTRLLAGLRLEQQMQDELAGISYYLKLKELVASYDERKEVLKAELAALVKNIFTRGGVLVSLTTDEEKLGGLQKAALALLESFPEAAKIAQERTYTPAPKREGIQVSSNVQYVVKGFDFKELGATYSGDMTVLSAYLSKTYLHKQIRAQGGAYGTSLTVGRDGTLLGSSYRDPNLQRTLDVYDGMATWLLEQELSPEETERTVIGALNRFAPPVNPKNLGALAYTRYLTGRTLAMAEKSLAEAMATTAEGLKGYASLLTEAMGKNYYCVVGNAKVLEENKDLFDELIRL